MSDTDMGTCPLPILSAQFKKTATKAFDENDFIRGVVFNIIAKRMDTCEELLSLWMNEITPELTSKELIDRTKKQLGRE